MRGRKRGGVFARGARRSEAEWESSEVRGGNGDCDYSSVDPNPEY